MAIEPTPIEPTPIEEEILSDLSKIEQKVDELRIRSEAQIS